MRIEKTAPILVIIAASMWGIDSIVLRPALYTLPVSLVVFLESLLVSLILSVFFIRRVGDIKSLTRGDWFAFVAVAVFGGAIGTMAITKALFYVNFVNLSIVVLIQKLQPVFTQAGAALILKERPAKKFFIWSALAIIGAYIMTFGITLPKFDSGNQTFMAASLALLAAVSFALSTIFSKRALRNIDYGLGTYIRFLIFSMVMLLIVIPSGDIAQVDEISREQFLILILIAVTTGSLATYLYYYGLKHITASVSSICELAFPLTAVLLEFILHDKILSIVQWTGVALLFISIRQVTGIRKIEEQSN